MAKFPRFMIAQNVVAEPDGEYVLHTQKPRFLAKKLHDNLITDFEIVDQIDTIDDSKITGIMRRLEDWYRAYNKHHQEHPNETDE